MTRRGGGVRTAGIIGGNRTGTRRHGRWTHYGGRAGRSGGGGLGGGGKIEGEAIGCQDGIFIPGRPKERNILKLGCNQLWEHPNKA